ncbi:hypothetical protein IAT38_006249 [Cryptococcus sp. DSM 104549]
MPPIPITFHFPTVPPSSKRSSSKSKSRTRKRSSKPLPPPTPIAITYDTSLTSTDSATVSSTNDDGQSGRPAKKRKALVKTAPPAEGKHATLTPLYRPIIKRCIAYTTPSPTPTFGTGSTGRAPNPYSPASDWGNTRSFGPSPGEVKRSNAPRRKRMTKEEARLKKERAARIKRIVAELKGEPVDDEEEGLEGSVTPSAGDVTPAASIGDEGATPAPAVDAGIPALVAPTEDTADLPASTPAPAPRASTLKRTRSLNNVHLTSGAVAVSSPLRSVITPSSNPSQPSATTDEPPAKHPRLDGPLDDRASRRAFTHSPLGTTPVPLPHLSSSPKTVPLPAGTLLPSRTSRASRASSAALGSPNLGVRGRRTVSNGLGGAGAGADSAEMGRSLSVGSDASAAVRERSRREVTIPNRLKDYETRTVG